MKKRSLGSQFDWGLFVLVLLLSGLGFTVLWSASHGADGEHGPYAIRQMQWFIIGLAAMAVCLSFDYRHLQTRATALYGGLLLLLVLVLVLGKSSMGAQRWLPLGPLRIQPSEFMKLGMAVMMANVLSRQDEPPPHGPRNLLLPAALTVVPVGLVLIQPDLGTAALAGAVALVVVLFQGVRRKVLLAAGGVFLGGLPLAWGFLKDYQRQRILTFLDPERDPLGAGYHIIQSKIAVGSGQILGKGFLHGTQARLQFLPERHTDFIFSVLAEEWGFLGSLFVLALYALLILWGLDIAAKARDTFGRLLAVGVTSIVFFHVVVNVGMVTGCLPVVGVPLPLFSYGGSSVLTTYLAVGILLNVKMRRFSQF